MTLNRSRKIIHQVRASLPSLNLPNFPNFLNLPLQSKKTLKQITQWAIALVSLNVLTACGGYPRYLDFPFDRGGRSLNSPSEELNPQISSPYLVFISDRNSSQAIFLFDTKSRRLVDLPGLNTLDEVASHPAISEDGRYIVFAASRQGKSDIYLYDRQTQQKRNLTESLNFETRNPTITTDGDRIAFEVAKNGQWDIMIMERSGTILNEF